LLADSTLEIYAAGMGPLQSTYFGVLGDGWALERKPTLFKSPILQNEYSIGVYGASQFLLVEKLLDYPIASGDEFPSRVLDTICL
jgi:hypothetical protein